MFFRMQYPKIKDNNLCDGRIHCIRPTNLYRIEDFELYYFEYFDEEYSSNCFTILINDQDGFKKMPLLNYDLLYQMLETQALTLTPVSINELFVNNRNGFINAVKPELDITYPLAQARAAIIIYIDEMGNLWIKNQNKYQKITSEQLSMLMQKYDIEWRMLNNDSLASDALVNSCLNKNFPRYDGLSFKEKYRIDDICHYSVCYTYQDSNNGYHTFFSI